MGGVQRKPALRRLITATFYEGSFMAARQNDHTFSCKKNLINTVTR